MNLHQKTNHLPKALVFTLGLVVLLFVPGLVSAQTNMTLASGATLTVEGTSTMHDWHMAMEKVNGSASMTVADGQLTGISKLTLTMLAEDLKSGKKGMDNNAYKAMNTEEHKNIKYALTKVKDIKAEGDGFKVTAAGNLTVAGTTKPIDLIATCSINGDGTVNCKGSTKFNMTEFGVDPPSFMFGTINTGDEITIKYDVNFAQPSN